MTHVKFECMKCGSCCKRILTDHICGTKNTKFGLCLSPKEVKIFDFHKETEIVPYIGLQRENWPKTKVIFYQMISEPCPLLNPETNLCTAYNKRPNICRAYPFLIDDGEILIENNCKFRQVHLNYIDVGRVDIIKGANQNRANLNLYNMFKSIENKLNSDRKITCVIFDFENDVWLTKKMME